MPSATAEELAAAIVEIVDAGAKVLNLSAALVQSGAAGEKDLKSALDYATSRGSITIAAAGNQGSVGSSAITGHPGVIAVAACDKQGKPIAQSNLGRSIALRGLSAPGDAIESLGTDGKTQSLGGTSAAAPFVTGAIALLWSEFPAARPDLLKYAVTYASRSAGRSAGRRNTVVPPLVNAWAAYQFMAENSNGRRV
jgi:subtilisin family serine protease